MDSFFMKLQRNEIIRNTYCDITVFYGRSDQSKIFRSDFEFNFIANIVIVFDCNSVIKSTLSDSLEAIEVRFLNLEVNFVKYATHVCLQNTAARY